ncbi:MAG: hypothetical protein IIA73_10795, partial [Proteobacteria bacterium]|nr:hypothetical protein [Pseudomonadota bacterium]
MFDHPRFDKYSFEDIPLNRDLYLMDEMWLGAYEQSLVTMFEGGDYENVGYISYAAARSVGRSTVELSWYPNIHTRFHEVLISLPREQFVTCVGCDDYDEKPRIFVKSAWLENLHLRSYSVFSLVDAIGFKKALESGSLTREKLLLLRDRIDAVAEQYPDISFISFADSLLLKSNWSVGQYNSHIKYNYEPEIFIRLISEIQSAYREVLGLGVYAVLTQGSNEYYDDPLLHISATKNHISLNSLGLPFAQLMSIERAARAAIRSKVHDPADLYMDENFFRSLSFVFEFQKDSCGKNAYREPLMGENSLYFFAD